MLGLVSSRLPLFRLRTYDSSSGLGDRCRLIAIICPRQYYDNVNYESQE